MNGNGLRPVLFLSLVHPDFLAPVYSLAQVLRDAGYPPTIVSFSSLAPGRFSPGCGIAMVDCGPHEGTAIDRRRARARFRSIAERTTDHLHPAAIISTCPFSYLEALRLADGRPVIYFVEEIYEATRKAFMRSPFTAWRNWRAERRLRDATLVAAPSAERAAFIAMHAGLAATPVTVLNCPYVAEDTGELDDAAVDEFLPQHFAQGILVVNTGRVSPTQGVLELVSSVEQWPDDARLVVTGIGGSQYSRQIRTAVERSTRRADICLLPLVPRAAMLALQRRAHVGICLLRRNDDPATKMPAPNKVGEYLQSGLLIVASRLPFLDQLPSRNVGELVDDLAPSQIARAVGAAVRRASVSGTRSGVQQVSREWLNMSVQAAPILALLNRTAHSGVR